MKKYILWICVMLGILAWVSMYFIKVPIMRKQVSIQSNAIAALEEKDISESMTDTTAVESLLHEYSRNLLSTGSHTYDPESLMLDLSFVTSEGKAVQILLGDKLGVYVDIDRNKSYYIHNADMLLEEITKSIDGAEIILEKAMVGDETVYEDEEDSKLVKSAISNEYLHLAWVLNDMNGDGKKDVVILNQDDKTILNNSVLGIFAFEAGMLKRIVWDDIDSEEYYFLFEDKLFYYSALNWTYQTVEYDKVYYTENWMLETEEGYSIYDIPNISEMPSDWTVEHKDMTKEGIYYKKIRKGENGKTHLENLSREQWEAGLSKMIGIDFSQIDSGMEIQNGAPDKTSALDINYGEEITVVFSDSLRKHYLDTSEYVADTICAETTVLYENETCSIHMRLPQLSEIVPCYDKVNQYLKNEWFPEFYAENVVGSYEPSVSFHSAKDDSDRERDTKYFVDTEIELLYADQNCLLFACAEKEYLGGIRVYGDYITILFDAVTGEKVSIWKLFNEDVSQEIIKQRIWSYIPKELREYGRDMGMPVDSNEVIEEEHITVLKDGIGIYFPRYVLGAGCDGDKMFVISYDKLDDISEFCNNQKCKADNLK